MYVCVCASGCFYITIGSETYTYKPEAAKILEGALYTIDSVIAKANNKLNQLRVDTAEAQKIIETPFAYEAELNTKSARLDTLTDELNKAAMEAKANNPNKERTAYFDRAKLKKEAMKAKKAEKKQEKNKDTIIDQP